MTSLIYTGQEPPLQVDNFNEALALATILVNPVTQQAYRVNVVDEKLRIILVIDEETGDHSSLTYDEVSGWTIFTLQKVVYLEETAYVPHPVEKLIGN